MNETDYRVVGNPGGGGGEESGRRGGGILGSFLLRSIIRTPYNHGDYSYTYYSQSTSRVTRIFEI